MKCCHRERKLMLFFFFTVLMDFAFLLYFTLSQNFSAAPGRHGNLECTSSGPFFALRNSTCSSETHLEQLNFIEHKKKKKTTTK